VTNELNLCAAHISEAEDAQCFVTGAGSLGWEINCPRDLTLSYSLSLSLSLSLSHDEKTEFKFQTTTFTTTWMTT